jgi:hypothetical protein
MYDGLNRPYLGFKHSDQSQGGSMRCLWIALPFALAACAPPKVSTPLDEIPKLTNLEKVMDNQATVMDPLFKKIDTPAFTDEDWAALTAASTRVQATSLKLKDFTKGPEFDLFATKLNQYAAALGNAYATKDNVAANDALKSMKATCKDCHKKFR